MTRSLGSCELHVGCVVVVWWSCGCYGLHVGCVWAAHMLHMSCMWLWWMCGGCGLHVGCVLVAHGLHMGCLCMRENGKMELWVWKWRTQKWPCKYGAQEFIGWQEARDEVLDFRWWHIFIWNHIAFMHGSNIWVLIRLPCNKIDHWKHSFLREACKF